jgi:hypothetical protein
VLQPSGGGQQQAETPQDDPETAHAESAMVELEQFTNVNLNILPPIPVLSPGQGQQITQPSVASADGLAVAFQGTSVAPGIGNQPGEATVSIFGASGTGTTFMYVFDRSGSMEGIPIRVAKAELIRSLDSLDDTHRFNIIFYSGRNDWLLWQPGRRLVPATAQNKQSATIFVNGIMADGGTRHFEPLIEAINHRPDVIFFLTDGDPWDDLTPAELRDIENRNSRVGRGAQINVIQFGGGSFTDTSSRSLQQLADQNFGEFRYFNVLGLR